MAEQDELKTCDAVKPQIAPFVAGKLVAGEAAAVGAHLALCEICAQEAAFARLLTASVPRLPVPVPPPALARQIALATYAAPPRRTLREALLGFLFPAPARLALGTAFAVSVAALIVVPRLSPVPDSATPSVSTAPIPVAPDPVAVTPGPSSPARNTLTSPPAAPKSGKQIAKSAAAPATPKRDRRTFEERVTPLAPLAPKIADADVTRIARLTTDSAKTAKNPMSPGLPVMRRDKPSRFTVTKFAAPNRRTAPPVSAETKVPVIASTDTTPKPQEEIPAEEAPTRIEADMDRATRVATAVPEPVPGAGEDPVPTAPRSGFTLGAAGLRASLTWRGSILPNRSSREVATGSGVVSLVRAPVN